MSSPVLLSVRPVLDELISSVSEEIRSLGRAPRMALIRGVSDGGAESMQQAILSACQETGVEPWVMELPDYIPQETLVHMVHRIGQDPSIDGVAVLCPEQYDLELLGSAIGEEKDINGFSRSSSARFLPCFDSAALRVLSLFPDYKEQQILITDYREADHYILKRALDIHGCTVYTQADNILPADCSADLIFAAGELPVPPGPEPFSCSPSVISLSLDPYGSPKKLASEQPAASCFSQILPVPGGIDRIIPYIYAYNTVFSVK